MNRKQHDDEIQEEINNFHRLKDLRIEDNLFNMVALNLSGKRDYYEGKAFELIKKHGKLKALKLSKESM